MDEKKGREGEGEKKTAERARGGNRGRKRGGVRRREEREHGEKKTQYT